MEDGSHGREKAIGGKDIQKAAGQGTLPAQKINQYRLIRSSIPSPPHTKAK